MSRTPAAVSSLLLAALLAAAAAPAAAQTAPAANKAQAKKFKPTKPTKAPPKPLPPADPPAASAEQMEAAQLVYLGHSDCEFKQHIEVEPNGKFVGYVDVTHQKRTYTMKPVLSSTGAMRLEDITGETLLIQIANKSMLLNVKMGQRIVDECVHPKQRAAIEAARANSAPAPSLLQ